MIDAEGFRPNVGMILCNSKGQVLWAKRIGHNAWQFPQGGIAEGETPEEALYRELGEEVGLQPEHVTILGQTSGWLHYRLPQRYIRQDEPAGTVCIGQKQKWFLLQVLADDSQIRLDASTPPEFDHWTWVSYWYPLSEVVSFKKDVYRKALLELAPKLPVTE